MDTVLRVTDAAAEIDAAQTELLLTGADARGQPTHSSPECAHSSIRFVPGNGFKCADCWADVSDLG